MAPLYEGKKRLLLAEFKTGRELIEDTRPWYRNTRPRPEMPAADD
jgi:hypothetical protein